MDILEEIEETLNEKKRKWNYTPMREKNETDALIDELLREFSSENRTTRSERKYSSMRHYTDYNVKTEAEEREEYNRSVYSANTPEDDATKAYSINDLPDDETASSYNNSGFRNDNNDYSNDDEGYNDDYYDDEYDEEFDVSHKMNTEEFAEFLDAEDDSMRDDVPRRRNPWKTAWRIIYTAIIAAFTIIGIFSSAIYCLERLEMTPADKQEKENILKAEVQKVIYPLVETEVSDFESFDDITAEELINISVWEIVINGNIKVFRDSETKKILIPQTQIEYIVEKLFGSEDKIENTTSGVGNVSIVYDKEQKGYIVPENTDIYTMYPVVTNVSVSDDIYTLNVECYNDLPAWNSEKKTAPAKKMVFTLKKTSDYYNIISAKTVS
ncbi:MAG: hypothetical protein K2F60_04270 [Oscillospiraceae bacterium]|nr:hypothetical protein [Oscillospiraceae bacterium]